MVRLRDQAGEGGWSLGEEALKAGVSARAASMSCVSCTDSPEVGLFSWLSKERELLFVECVPRARLCSGCFRGIVSF